MPSPAVKIILFEDNKELREGLQAILNGSPGFTCVGAFANGNNLIRSIRQGEPNVVLMDIQMPGISGIEAVAILRQEFPELPVLMHTVFEDESKVFAAICAGANGYILKSTVPIKFLEAIKEVADGGSAMTASIASRVLKMFRQQNAKADVINSFDLSNREKEILSFLVEGNSYKMIADKLYISYETVHSHVKKIYQKLHVNSVNEAVSKAIRNKLV
jgi:DNA-binding NarL/FixJ family response regulator